MMAQLKVVSYGGGVQSTSLLAMAAQGELDIQTFLFANVGDDSEHPATLRYVHDVAMPYAKEHGIELIEVQRPGLTLLQHIRRPGNKAEVIPVRLGNGMPASRICTSDWKIKVIARWLKGQGATKDVPAQVNMGISLDEFQRMRTSSGYPFYTVAYPLIERRMRRQDCVNVIAHAELPVPPKSSCWFCPFHRMARWREMADTEQELFAQSVALERHINEQIRVPKGRDPVYLTDALKPLDKAVGDKTQGKLFEADPGCDSGFCFL